MFFPYHPEYSAPMRLGSYAVLDIPAIGSTVTDDGTTSGQLLIHEGPERAGQFVAPFDCRVTGIGYSMTWGHTGPNDGCTGLRIGVMNCQFTNDTNPRTADATWKCLARVDTTAMTGDPPPQVQKGTATFASSNGDVDAGELIGIVYQPLGTGNSGLIYGVITVMMEPR
tara:strand:- start:135 stop:641 length:507 start_codon:yes stop_codon:yes gene_type:complete